MVAVALIKAMLVALTVASLAAMMSRRRDLDNSGAVELAGDENRKPVHGLLRVDRRVVEAATQVRVAILRADPGRNDQLNRARQQ